MPDLSHGEFDLMVAYFDDEGEELAMKAASAMRKSGLRVESHLGAVKVKKVFKVAESKGHVNVALIGGDEVKEQKVTLKNMKERKQETFSLDQMDAIVEFLSSK